MMVRTVTQDNTRASLLTAVGPSPSGPRSPKGLGDSPASNSEKPVLSPGKCPLRGTGTSELAEPPLAGTEGRPLQAGGQVSWLRPVGRCPDSSAQPVRGMPDPSVSLMQTSHGYPATIPFLHWAILVSIWLGFHNSLEMTALSAAGSLALRCIPLDEARPLSQGQRERQAQAASSRLPFSCLFLGALHSLLKRTAWVEMAI